MSDFISRDVVLDTTSYPIRSISSKAANSIQVDYDRLEGFKDYVESMFRDMQMIPTFEHKCNNCGGTLEMRTDEHIFKCPYCYSVYAVGTKQING